MYFPESDGWNCNGVPVVTFTLPSASVTGTAACTDGQLIVTTAGLAIDQGTLVRFTTSGILTPASNTPKKNDGKLNTRDEKGGLIDFSSLFTDRISSPIRIQLTGQTPLDCPNQCSRRGMCKNYGICDCYARPGTSEKAWTGADCSQRTCPKGKSWADLASADDTAHRATECSSQGSCDRKTGQCACFDGYDGIACQKSSCPNDCNGNGRCVTQEILAYEAFKTYSSPWDANMESGCVCDAGNRGVDCSLQECPTTADTRGGPGSKFGRDCSGRGMCDYSSGLCNCFVGYYGTACEFQAEVG